MTVWSFGYQRYTPTQLQAWVDAHDGIVVDVRLNPRSSRQEWDRESLERLLGPSYRHLRHWGNLDYKTGGMRLASPNLGYQVVRDELLPTGSPLVVMCMCPVYDRCHRKLAIEYLIQRMPHIRCEELLLPPAEPSPQLSMDF